jgi:uncharacterized protein (DUF2225 family)
LSGGFSTKRLAFYIFYVETHIDTVKKEIELTPKQLRSKSIRDDRNKNDFWEIALRSYNRLDWPSSKEALNEYKIYWIDLTDLTHDSL